MSEAKACEVCGGMVVDLRRGRCFGCYSKWADSRAVGLGAACTLCGDRRRDNLRQMELHGAWLPLCYNCAGRTLRLSPVPRTLDGLRRCLARERRDSDRRRGEDDTRPLRVERRGLERRAVGHAGPDGDLLLVEEMCIELGDEDILPAE